MDNKIVNIVNFVRAVEPRDPELDLFEPVREHMRLIRQHDLPATWLLQYDALISGPYVEFLKENMPSDHEVGIWFEVVQPNVEAAGLTWRGRYPWDWHTDVGFSVGYTPEEREKIADVFMEEFKKQFGYYPKVMGSWFFDAHLLGYLQDRYGLDATCNCRDQWGTDGYTLWGGYWANGYYPARRNAFLPAQTPAEQISVPLFRMLGSDPIYQYGVAPTAETNGQPVITLEPVYLSFGKAPAGGGCPAWIDWFLEENFKEPNGAMSYAQVGQENSFGWSKMRDGITYQYRRLEELRQAGAFRVETLGETGRWFKDHFRETPVSVVPALNDWKKENRSSVWYLAANWRMNFFRTPARELQLRDWQVFDEQYTEPFLNSRCTTQACCYDALPLIDGMRWGAALKLASQPGEIAEVAMPDEQSMRLTWKADDGTTSVVTATPTLLEIQGSAVLELSLDTELAKTCDTAIAQEGNTLVYLHNKERYVLVCESGTVETVPGGFRLAAGSNGLLRLTVRR